MKLSVVMWLLFSWVSFKNLLSSLCVLLVLPLFIIFSLGCFVMILVFLSLLSKKNIIFYLVDVLIFLFVIENTFICVRHKFLYQFVI